MALNYSTNREREEECLVRFLLSASAYVNSLSSNVLKTHMNILCADTLRIKSFSMMGRDKKDQYCLYCLSSWKKGNYSTKILPTPKKGKRTKRILRKIINNKPLANIETKIINKRYFVNKTQLKCLICKHTTKFITKNKKREACLTIRRDKLLKLSKKRKQVECQSKKKKSKKRKLNYHGLNPKAVEQIKAPVTDIVCEVEPTHRKPSPQIVASSSKDDDVDKLECHPPMNTSYRHAPQTQESTQGNKKKKKKKKRNRKKKNNKNSVMNPLPFPQFGCLNSPPSMPNKRPEKNVSNSNCFNNLGECSAPKKRKLSKWKKLMNEEEIRPRNTNSLKHFLSGL